MFDNLGLEKCSVLSHYNADFARGKSSWIKQRSNSLSALIVVAAFSNAVVVGTALDPIAVAPKYRTGVIIGVSVVGGISTLICANRFLMYSALCARGRLVVGKILSLEPTEYNDSPGVKVTYEYADYLGEVRSGEAEGARLPEEFQVGGGLYVLIDNQSKSHAVL